MQGNIEEYLDIKQKVEDIKKEMVAKLSELIEYIMRKEDIKNFLAVGYTPSFNDGDPCEYYFTSGVDACEYFDSHIEDLFIEIGDDTEFIDEMDFTDKVLYNLAKSFGLDSGSEVDYAPEDKKFRAFDCISDIFESHNPYGMSYFANIDSDGNFKIEFNDYESY